MSIIEAFSLDIVAPSTRIGSPVRCLTLAVISAEEGGGGGSLVQPIFKTSTLFCKPRFLGDRACTLEGWWCGRVVKVFFMF